MACCRQYLLILASNVNKLNWHCSVAINKLKWHTAEWQFNANYYATIEHSEFSAYGLTLQWPKSVKFAATIEPLPFQTTVSR